MFHLDVGKHSTDIIFRSTYRIIRAMQKLSYNSQIIVLIQKVNYSLYVLVLEVGELYDILVLLLLERLLGLPLGRGDFVVVDVA